MIVLKAAQEKVLSALQAVSGIVERRHTLPILANVLIKKTGGQIEFTTSDLEIQVRTTAEFDGDAGNFSTTVGARKLIDIGRVRPDDQVRLVAASRSFYDTFGVVPESAHGVSFYDLCGGKWDIPALRKLLAGAIPAHSQIDGYELDVHFPELGVGTLLLNARVVASQGKGGPTTLLVIKDITARRQIEEEKQKLLDETQGLLRQQRNLLSEMQHRVANSLQIIASILMLKARGVASQETRDHLKDAHQRVISVAEVQAHLHSVAGFSQVDVRAYLTKLSRGLASSMIGPSNPVSIEVTACDGTLDSSRAVSMGLIVTELVINAIKYAFPIPSAEARIVISYQVAVDAWTLKVSDNGIGNHPAHGTTGGLGTAIVAALARQLGGQITTVSNADGMTVSVTGVPHDARLPAAA